MHCINFTTICTRVAICKGASLSTSVVKCIKVVDIDKGLHAGWGVSTSGLLSPCKNMHPVFFTK